MGIKGFIKIVTYQTNLEDKNLHHFANKSFLTFVIQCPFFAFLLENKKNQFQGQSSGLLVTGGDYGLKVVDSNPSTTNNMNSMNNFSHIFIVKNCNVLFEKTKINEKGGMAHFLKRTHREDLWLIL